MKYKDTVSLEKETGVNMREWDGELLAPQKLSVKEKNE